MYAFFDGSAAETYAYQHFYIGRADELCAEPREGDVASIYKMCVISR